ncbi:hypothetical protein [Candidatus Marinarcus aquaticus]|uniref:Uncharacterized protein n=1 Tax=Candidatus Marinarcus aquaticus TaxID=2044504 RepID=A0A4Q0XSS6_9BACT|nr:hypothetical protein [Candidatus Marinarcus aquaticus]RXJ60083.1 hypothetical protein CRV04_03470 [Candidatus Marinarcus aquaticus]
MGEIIGERKNVFDNAYVLFGLFIVVVITNTISSIYFISIMLAGVVYVAFTRCLKTQNYYAMIYVILSFLFIELNNGFKPFSIILLGSFIYVYLIPFLTRVMVLDSLNEFLQIVLLYVGIIFIWSLTHDTNFLLFKIIFFNFILDLVLIGFAP